MIRRRRSISCAVTTAVLAAGCLLAAPTTAAEASTGPAAICSGQTVSGSITWGAQMTYTISVPPGQTLSVHGTVDVLDRDWTGGWQTILYIDPVFWGYFGSYYGGPYTNLPFGGSWTNYGSSAEVTLTVRQEAGSHTSYRFVVEVSGDQGCGEDQGGGTDPGTGSGTDPGSGSGGGGTGTDPAGPPDPERYDTDGDRLPDSVEKRIGTDPGRADTDGDGLLDPWEVSDSVAESGFFVPNPFDPNLTVHIDNRQVYDLPAADIPVDVTDSGDGRIPPELQGGYLNDPTHGAPDPLHKDVYLEIDFQDCAVEYSRCPRLNVPFFPGDPMHHTPSLRGLALVQDMFRNAGIRLHIQLDDASDHRYNCMPDGEAVRGSYFGTERQRSQEVAAAKRKVFRWMFSGHSTVADNPCRLPSLSNFMQSILGTHNLPSYDDTPFGRADARGRTIIASLSPLWACPRYASTFSSGPITGATCFRSEAQAWLPTCVLSVKNVPCGTRLVDAGIFPAYTLSPRRHDFDRPQSERLFPGRDERTQVALLWARVFAHLLGQSLGITDDAVLGNSLDPAAIATTPTPQPYASWDGLALAPPDDAGQPFPESERYPTPNPPGRRKVKVASTAGLRASSTPTRVPARFVCDVAAPQLGNARA